MINHNHSSVIIIFNKHFISTAYTLKWPSAVIRYTGGYWLIQLTYALEFFFFMPSESSNQRVLQPASRPTSEWSNQPVLQPASRPTSQSSNQWVAQPVSRPTSESSNQSVGQLASRPRVPLVPLKNHEKRMFSALFCPDYIRCGGNGGTLGGCQLYQGGRGGGGGRRRCQAGRGLTRVRGEVEKRDM